MEIKTLYDIGDKIKYKAHIEEKHSITCPFCKGAVEIEIEGKILYCQNCEYGMITISKTREAEIVGEIELIDFSNFGTLNGSKIPSYRTKISKDVRESGMNWCDETDIIEKLNK